MLRESSVKFRASTMQRGDTSMILRPNGRIMNTNQLGRIQSSGSNDKSLEKNRYFQYWPPKNGLNALPKLPLTEFDCSQRYSNNLKAHSGR